MGGELAGDETGDGEVAGARIGGGDDGPRGARAVGGVAEAGGGAGEAVVETVVATCFVGDAPRGVGVGGELGEAETLFALGEVEPDLDDERAVVGEEFFEVPDVFDVAGGRGGGETLGGLCAEELGIPGAGEDAEATVDGKAAPETPHERTFAFLVGRLAERERFDAAGVEPAAEGVDDITAATGFFAGENEKDFGRNLFQADLETDEFLAEGGDTGVVNFLAQARGGTRVGHDAKRESGAARGVELCLCGGG